MIALALWLLGWLLINAIDNDADMPGVFYAPWPAYAVVIGALMIAGAAHRTLTKLTERP